VAISDVSDDPRIQYPAEAIKEGIASILAVPIMARGNPIGAIRIYTAEPWDATLEDVNFVQAVAQIAGMAIEMSRLYKGLKSSIEILKAARDPREVGAKRWTPHEGVPVSAGKLRPSGVSST
jgi:GAF domain-containing protein